MTGWLPIILLNYGSGLVIELVLASFYWGQIKESVSWDETPENAREIRNLVNQWLLVSLILLLFGFLGATLIIGGFHVSHYLWRQGSKELANLKEEFKLLREVGRRFGKAKREQMEKPKNRLQIAQEPEGAILPEDQIHSQNRR